MRILVTGANGQVGHELLRALSESPPFQGEGLGGDGVEAGARSTHPHPVPPLEGEGEIHPLRNEGGRAAGAGGWNAREIIPATRNGTLDDGTPCERIDLADPDDLRTALDRIAPDLIVNAAAYTAVDRAEDEPELAMRVNGDAVGVIGAWAAARGARVVHYSTDYVFDGRATRPYREDDATHPLGVYGRSKLAGEVALRDSGARHLVLRTAWVYGARGKNFLRTMLRLGAERDELRVVDDQIGAPTSAGLIADVTARMIARWFAADDAASRGLDGTCHLVASGSTSWCGFARAIFERVAVLDASGAHGRAHPPPRFARVRFAPPFLRKGEAVQASRAKGEENTPFGTKGGPEGRARSAGAQRRGDAVAAEHAEMPSRAPHITAITTAEYSTRATRPAFSVLDTSKLRGAFHIDLPDWQTALDDVIGELTGRLS